MAQRTAPHTPATHGSVDTRLRVGGFLLTETTHEPGTRLPRHAHRDDAITLILHGEFAESFRGRRVECRSGGLLIKPAGASHTNAYGDRGARSLLIDAIALERDHRRVAERVYDDIRYFPVGPANHAALRIAAELRILDAPAHLAIEGLLLELLAAAARARPVRLSRTDPTWLQRAVDYLHESWKLSVRLSQLADAAEVSPTTLTRVFRRRFGLTPGAYQRRLRVEHARNELLHTNHTLSEIAFASGFTDQSHLTRVFTRAYGVTPGAYRRQAGSPPAKISNQTW